jgi:hypothetical protein
VKLGFTIHEIRKQAADKTRSALPIGSVQEFNNDEYESLMKLGAIRTPSEAEIAIYEATAGKASVKSPKASGRKASTASTEETALAGDPDEVENI